MRRVPGRALLLAVGLLAVLLAVLEILARQPAVQARLTPPSFGAGQTHELVGIKVVLLDQFAAEGPVDCIFIGSSMVAVGVDPQVFAEAYTAETGDPLRCFNFGQRGFTAMESVQWAEIVIRRYHPRLLIYGHSMRDYNSLAEGEAAAPVSNPWERYQLGEFTLGGWLTENLFSYRYYDFYRFWISPDFAERVAYRSQYAEVLEANGFEYDYRMMDTSGRPDPEEHAGIYNYFANYQLYPPDLDSLDYLLGLQDRYGVSLVVAELPLPESFAAFVENTEVDYAAFLDAVNSRMLPDEVLTVSSPPPEIIPSNGWLDFMHLNVHGSPPYSEWLGRQIGLAATRGEFTSIP